MACCSTILLKIFLAIVGLIKVGCAAAILCIVPLKLMDLNYALPSLNGTSVNTTVNLNVGCALGNFQSQSLCVFSLALAGISLAACLALFLLLCCTCDLCGLGFLLEAAFAGFGAFWWLAGSIVLQENVHGTKLNTSQWDSIDNWRLSILVLSWASFGLFVITFTVFVLKLLSSMCTCLGCCCPDNKVHP